MSKGWTNFAKRKAGTRVEVEREQGSVVRVFKIGIAFGKETGWEADLIVRDADGDEVDPTEMVGKRVAHVEVGEYGDVTIEVADA